MRSRVMPGSSPTMERREPVRRLNSVDLPTLGRPTMAKTGWSSTTVADCLMRDFLLLDFLNLLADLTGRDFVPQRQMPQGLTATGAVLRSLMILSCRLCAGVCG